MTSDQELMALAEAFEKDPTVLGIPGETLTGEAARAESIRLFAEVALLSTDFQLRLLREAERTGQSLADTLRIFEGCFRGGSLLIRILLLGSLQGISRKWHMDRYQELAQAAEAFEKIDPSEIDWSRTTIEYPATPLTAQQWPAVVVEREPTG